MTSRRNSEVTGKRTASQAGKVLRNPKMSAAAKIATASLLSQVPNRKRRK